MCACACVTTSAVVDRSVQFPKLNGEYSDRVQLPAKAKFGGFVANTKATLATTTITSIKCKQSPVYGVFDRYFHIPLPIVRKHELGLPIPSRNLPIKFGTNPSTIFLVTVVTHRHKPTPVKTYSLAFVGERQQKSAKDGQRQLMMAKDRKYIVCHFISKWMLLTSMGRMMSRILCLCNTRCLLSSSVKTVGPENGQFDRIGKN